MFNKVLFIAIIATVYAQVVFEIGVPTEMSLLKSEVESKVMPDFDVQAFITKARSEPKDQQGGMLFAQQFPVSFSPLNSGTWETLADGTQVWRLIISSKDAVSMNLVFSKYTLYPGNQLFAYNVDQTIVRGPFSAWNNKEDGGMALAPIRGEEIVLELIVRPNSQMPIFEVGFVNHEVMYGFGDSGSCNINTVCSYTDDFNMRDEVDAAAMILTAAGSRRCSGTMINNAAQNSRQLFLTANHCLGGENSWIFMFNYQSTQCNLAQQTDGPTSQSVQGSRLLGSGAASDVALLELTEQIPANYDVYLAGFNAVNTATIPFAIHHPSGDIKKIAWSEQNTVSDQWSGTNRDTHWQVVQWHGPGNGAGNQGDRTTTEPGSSGSGLFDPQGRLVGQLHGGAATCTFPYDDLYGKLSYSYDNVANVRTNLDPTGTGIRQVNGIRLNARK